MFFYSLIRNFASNYRIMYMKQLLLLIISLLFAHAIQAQDLKVRSMSQDIGDLSASTYERKDLNGAACALVKVQLPAYGAKFEGNIIGNIEYKTGEYWVYMTEGSRELRIKHPNYLPLHVFFNDHGIGHGVKGKQTYTLTVAMQQMNGIIDDGMRYLVLNIEPSDANATVIIDGDENKAQTAQNGTVSVLLSMGDHRYLVRATSYEDKRGTVTIGNDKVTLPIRLTSTMATLNISTSTSGTQIFVNDQLRGTNSWTGSLPAGTYRVEGRLTGHRNHQQIITLQQRDQKQIAIPALQAIMGNLNVNFQPTNTEVWIDGKKAGNSPDIFRNIHVGNHDIELRANGYDNKKIQVTIEEGKTASLTGSLNKLNIPSTTNVSTSSSVTSSTVSDVDIKYRTVNNFTHVSGPQLFMYGIVVGSFSLEANAKGLADRLTSNGYTPTIIKDVMVSPEMFRVVQATTNNKNSVPTLLEKAKENYPGSWVLYNPNAASNTASGSPTVSSAVSSQPFPSVTMQIKQAFDKNNSLTENAKTSLREIAAVMLKNPSTKATISINTNNIKVKVKGSGSESAYKKAYLKAKAEIDRPENIINYLVASGVAKNRLQSGSNLTDNCDASIRIFE